MKKIANKPLVSVIMPCYNHEKYVENSIKSVLNQTYSNIEFFVLDNGSTDGSYEVINKYKDNITEILQLNKNDLVKAYEILNSKCIGKYVACMTSDDLWEPDKIEKQVEILERNSNIKACFTWADSIDVQGNSMDVQNVKFNEQNKTRYEWLKRIILGGNCLAFPSCLIYREIYVKIFEEKGLLWQLGDMYMWLLLLLKHDIYIIEEKLTHFLWHVSGEVVNLSAPSLETDTRTYNENAYVVSKIIEKMDDEIFINVFSEFLIDKDVKSHDEILCEKFLLLSKISENYLFIQNNVISFYFDQNKYILGEGYNLKNILKQKYNYTMEDFLKYSGSRGVGATHIYNLILQNKVKELEESTAELLEKLNISNNRYEMQEEKFQKQQIWIEILNEIVVSDLDVENRKKKVRKKIYSKLSDSTKELIDIVVKYTKTILLYVTENKDIKSEKNTLQLIENVYGIEKGLNVLWDGFLYMDFELMNGEWKDNYEKILAKSITKKDFFEKTIPFLSKIYVVLSQYVS